MYHKEILLPENLIALCHVWWLRYGFFRWLSSLMAIWAFWPPCCPFRSWNPFYLRWRKSRKVTSYVSLSRKTRACLHNFWYVLYQLYISLSNVKMNNFSKGFRWRLWKNYWRQIERGPKSFGCRCFWRSRKCCSPKSCISRGTKTMGD